MDIAEVQIAADASGVDKANASLDKLDRTAGKVEKSTDKMNRENQNSAKIFGSMGRAATLAAGSLIGIAAATKGISAAITTIKEFTSAMSQVAAISRANTLELAQMTLVARELGATTVFSATEAAEGMKFLAQAGFTAKESISAIPGVLDLATASALGLGTAADIASNVMSGFGIEAENSGRAVDILAAISSRANTDVLQLGDAAAYVGPVAAAMGISLGDASAAIGVLSDAGIQGSAAGTGLRRVLSSLANPGKEATDVLQGLGIKLSEVDPAANSLTDVIDRLAETGLSAADALTIFGDRGGPAILALTANNDRVSQLAEEMKSVDGEAKRMAETMGDNLTGDTKELTSALSELALQLGDAGVTAGLRSFVQGLTTTVRVTGFLTDEIMALFGVIRSNDFVRIGDEIARIESLLAHQSSLPSWLQNDGLIAKAEKDLAIYRQQMEAIEKTWTEAGKATDDYSKRLKAASKTIDAASADLLNMAAASRQTAEEQEAAAEAAEEFASSLQAVKDAADPLQAEVNQLTREYKLMQEGMEAGMVTNEEWAQFLDYALPEVTVKAKRLTAEVKQLEEAADPLATSFNRGIERMRDGVGDFFEDFLQDGKASFGDFIDLFKSMIAEMIATAAANRIFVGLGLVGSSGAATAGELAASTVGGTGGLGDLASTASSIYSAFGTGLTGLSTKFTTGLTSIGGGSTVVGLQQAGSVFAPGAQGVNQVAIGGLASAGAGFAGSYAGQKVFQNENSTGIGATAGTLVGTYVGALFGGVGAPVGAAIGGFLGEGIEAGLAKVFGYKEGGNNAGGGAFDLGAGTSSLALLGNNGGANLETAKGLVETLQAFATSIGGSDFTGNLQVGDKDGIKFNGTKYSDSEKFFEEAFADIIEGAENLSGVAKTILKDFDGGAEELAAFAVTLSSIESMLDFNPVQAAMKDFSAAQEQAAMTTTTAYNRQIEAIRRLVSEYDGSLQSTAVLNDAMVLNQKLAYDMSIGMQQMRLEMVAMIGSSTNAIRESVLTEEELFQKRKDERNQLQKDLRVIEDAGELRDALVQIEQLNSQLFQSLDDPTVEQANQYAQFAETSLKITEDRLGQMQDALEQSQNDQINRVGQMLQDNANRQAQSNQVFADAVEAFVEATSNYSGNQELAV